MMWALAQNTRRRINFSTGLAKKRTAGLVLLAVMLGLFLALNRFPKLDTIRGDIDTVSASTVECFQGFCIETEAEDGSDTSFVSRWLSFSVEYLRNVTVGMTFAFLVAGLTEAFLFPRSSGSLFASGGILRRTFKGLAMGPVWNLCSACIAPVSASFRRRGAGIEGAIAMVQGSSTLNVPSLVMAAMIFTPMLGGSRIVLGLLGGLLIGPLVAMVVREKREEPAAEEEDQPALVDEDESTWGEALIEGLRDWSKASIRYLVQMGPIMVAAGFVSGLVIQWVSPETIGTYLGNNATGIAIAATLGVLINVPLMFEIPLVALLLLLGMGAAPAATLLFAAAAGGPVTFWSLGRVIPRKGIVAFAAMTWGVALTGGLVVWGLSTVVPDADIGLRPSVVTASETEEASTVVRENGDASSQGVTPWQQTAPKSTIAGATSVVATTDSPKELIEFLSGSGRLREDAESGPMVTFTDVAPLALEQGYKVWNNRPGVAIFDFDRDGDLDFYLTAEGGYANWLYRNNADGTFTDVAKEAGVMAKDSHSTGAVACDIDNDGYQDLYVGAWGDPNDFLDFRSPTEGQGNKDYLFLNNGDGTFLDITDAAFGDNVNLRSAIDIACADVDGDGWVDFYVGNLMADEFRVFDEPQHAGHYNVLYRNNGDLTFSDVSEEAGVKGPQILMRDSRGVPILFEDPETGEMYEGYDPNVKDRMGNRVGEPTGQTHAVLFFDYDDDGDPDIWVSNDGDRLRVYRNDSSPGQVRFTPVERAMGIDQVGAWMGFAVGDYDGDADLDVFITNVGFHPVFQEPKQTPRGACSYHMRFAWGTCYHFLLRNDGTREVASLGTVGDFKEVARSTEVKPSPWLPPNSLDLSLIDPGHEAPTGLAAYEFGFGTTFFDFDNDADQDLYWLGGLRRGEGPGGSLFPSSGRLMQGDGAGSFEDVTVRARMLDISRVNYEGLENDPWPPIRGNLLVRRIDQMNHESGKGLAHGDLNGDGYVDLIGTNNSGELFTSSERDLAGRRPSEWFPGPTFVWMNGGGENHWITLRLQGRMAVDGTGSNADGIGARVYLKTVSDNANEPLVQVQEVIAGSSYLSMDSLDLEFGLGSATIVDEVLILWPSGRTQTLENVAVDQVLNLTEPEG